MSVLDRGILTGLVAPARTAPYVVVEADAAGLAAHRALRHEVFVRGQGLFVGHDLDLVDEDPRTVVLVARTPEGDVVGGVRLGPVTGASGGRDIGWWQGGRLAVSQRVTGATGATGLSGVGSALVRAACARAEAEGALRFDAEVQARHEPFFARLGWMTRGPLDPAHCPGGLDHVAMSWPVDRVARLAAATKQPLGGLLAGLTGGLGGGGAWLGDDGAPVPGTDVVAACDAILPAMVERDPEWAGWCAVLVNLNDLSAMGAAPVGMLDAVGARDASFARRILAGLGEASRAWDVPVLGGHTQLGVPAALSVTALGRTSTPVPGGGARAGQALRVSADLGGGWRPGYSGAQWDSSSHRTGAELRALAGVVPALRPTAAKDVSMSGLVGTTGMLAEASGVRAVLDVAAVPAPAGATAGDWLTCFPGFAMVTAEPIGRADAAPVPDFVTTALCGEVGEGAGVGLRWPDGVVTEATPGRVTGLGPARVQPSPREEKESST